MNVSFETQLDMLHIKTVKKPKYRCSWISAARTDQLSVTSGFEVVMTAGGSRSLCGGPHPAWTEVNDVILPLITNTYRIPKSCFGFHT